jgi:predicted cupin superfamily sugar epimerase
MSEAERIVETLKLQGGSTCGYTGPTFTSPIRIPQSSLGGYDGDRAAGFCQYFLVTKDAQVQLHRIRSSLRRRAAGSAPASGKR